MSDKIPTPEELVARARAMIPTLKERALKQTENRRLLPETVAEMNRAGFFRILQSKRYGGYEMDPTVFAEVQWALAEGDMSASWVLGVVGVHAFQLALFDDRAPQDVWGKDSSILVASTYMPTGKATPVEGGFRFSGKWKFSSGIEHCKWVLLGGLVNPGQTETPDYRTFLLPESDYRIVDTWKVLGLKGTGSQDIVVDDVFIPDYRVHNLIDAYHGTNPGYAVNKAPLYRMPFVQVFARVVTNPCIGGLQALLDGFSDYMAKRITVTGGVAAQDPDAQLAVAEAMAGLYELKTVYYKNMEILRSLAETGKEVDVPTRLLFKYQSGEVAERCLRLAQNIFKTGGGHAVFDDSPWGRILSDMMVARQHVQNQSPIYGRNLGKVLLGLPNQDVQI